MEVRRILVLADDHWHPASVVQAGLAPLEEQGYEMDWVIDPSGWSPAALSDYAVIIFSKSNNTTAADNSPWMNQETQEAFVDYVDNGGSILFSHSGTASYGEIKPIRDLIGGIFEHHPKQCPVTMTPKKGHPLTAGCPEYTAMDEHYHMIIDDPDVDLFMTTTSEHGTQPGGWTRTVGRGRVCVLTPGHNSPVWLHPSFQQMLKNCIAWCAGA